MPKGSLLILFGLALVLKANSQNWIDLDGGTNYFIRTLYSDPVEGKLFVGGDFWEAGQKAAYDIASWNGNWELLGNGMCHPASSVTSIVRFQDTLIAGGGFLDAGCDSIQYLARWYDNLWHPFGKPNGYIGVLSIHDQELYVGGAFDSIGGIAANGLAKWNGIYWSTVGNFPDYSSILDQNVVGRICFFNDTIYVAGILVDSNQNAVNYASFDGEKWKYHKILNGPFAGGAPAVVYKNELYLIGLFLKAEGNAGNCIMKWNGSTWIDVNGGVKSQMLYPQLTDAIVYHDKLYVVGIFDTAGGIAAKNIAMWDGSQWCGVGSDIDNKILTIEIFQDTLYIAGGFTSIDGMAVNNVARWSGVDYNDTCSIPVGINESMNRKNDFFVYPNPTQSVLMISCSQAINSVSLINSLGTKVSEVANRSQATLDNNQIQLDVSDLTKGIYLIEINTREMIYHKKIIKE